MEKIESFVIKMSNDEYLTVSQHEDDTLLGFTDDVLICANKFTEAELENIPDAMKNGTKVMDVNGDKVFNFLLYPKYRDLIPTSYQKVMMCIEEETVL